MTRWVEEMAEAFGEQAVFWSEACRDWWELMPPIREASALERAADNAELNARLAGHFGRIALGQTEVKDR